MRRPAERATRITRFLRRRRPRRPPSGRVSASAGRARRTRHGRCHRPATGRAAPATTDCSSCSASRAALYLLRAPIIHPRGQCGSGSPCCRRSHIVLEGEHDARLDGLGPGRLDHRAIILGRRRCLKAAREPSVECGTGLRRAKWLDGGGVVSGMPRIGPVSIVARGDACREVRAQM